MRLRETYLHTGPRELGDPELLALVLGTGTRGETALDVARSLIDRFGDLGGVLGAEPQQLGDVRGVGMARAVRIHAALQLGRRALGRRVDRPVIRSAGDAHAALEMGLVGLADEELHGLFLDRRRAVLGQRVLTRGCHAFTIVDPRQIFRVALQLGASAVILAHNHPSDDPTPSEQDVDVTARVARAGRVLGVPLLDHLVVARGAWVSLAQRGHLPATTDLGVPWTA